MPIIESKIEDARRFATYFEQLLEDADDEDTQDVAASLLTVAKAYVADLKRVQERRKLTADEWITTRNCKLLAEVLIHEIHEQEDLSGWYMGCDPGQNILYAVATFVTESHLWLVGSLQPKAHKRDFEPLTDEQIAAIQRLIT